jgi:hypothetical protein
VSLGSNSAVAANTTHTHRQCLIIQSLDRYWEVQKLAMCWHTTHRWWCVCVCVCVCVWGGDESGTCTHAWDYNYLEFLLHISCQLSQHLNGEELQPWVRFLKNSQQQTDVFRVLHEDFGKHHPHIIGCPLPVRSLQTHTYTQSGEFQRYVVADFRLEITVARCGLQMKSTLRTA